MELQWDIEAVCVVAMYPTHRRQEVPNDEVIQSPISVSQLVSGGTAHGCDRRMVAGVCPRAVQCYCKRKAGKYAMKNDSIG